MEFLLQGSVRYYQKEIYCMALPGLSQTRRHFWRDEKFSFWVQKGNELLPEKWRRENLILKFRSGNRSEFWKGVKNLYGKNSELSSYIDGCSDPVKIASIFDEKFSTIFNDPQCQSEVINILSENSPINRCPPIISFHDVNRSIEKINPGLGWDRIHSNHFKLSGPVFRNLISKLFNKFLSHNYLPRPMLEGQIRPVLKSGSSSKTDSANFRPIMNSSNFLKIFECCLLPYLMNHLNLNNL